MTPLLLLSLASPLVLPAVLAAPTSAMRQITIDGRVLEQGTGAPVPDAELRLRLFQLPEEIVYTDVDGRFHLTAVVGTEVHVEADGHAAVDLTVPDDPSWRIYLRRAQTAMEVVVEARRDDPVVSEQHLDRERVLQTPGTHEDPVRLVQSLPSVAQTPEYSPKSGDIAVRGSLPGDNRFFLDGVELPYLYHYNQYSSVFHTRLLNELTLYPSTFGAPWGDATGAVLDTRSVWNHPERIRASANLNLIMGGAEVDVPLAPEWTLRMSGRRSYLDAISGDSLQYTVFPVFGDNFFRLEHEPHADTRFALVTFGANDHYSRFVGEPTTLDPYENSVNPVLDFQQIFQVVAFQHQSTGDRGTLRGSLSFTAYEVDASMPTAAADRIENTLAVREDGRLDLSDHLKLALGTEVRGSEVYLDIATDRAWPEVSRESALLARGVADQETLTRVLIGAYAEPSVEIGTLRVTPGVRLDGDTLSKALTADPRLGLRWHAAPDTYVRAGAGVYSQFPDAEDLSTVLGSPDLRPARSLQLAFGADQAIAGRWELGLDAWAKQMHNLTVDQVDAAPVTGVDGHAEGISLTTRYRLRDVFFSWASLDLARSRRTIAGVESPSDYDQPVAVNLVGSWTFRPTWNVGLRYRLSTGLPYTPIVDGIYEAATDSYLPVEGAPNSARLPAYQKVDLHLEKHIELRRATLTPYLEVWYVPPTNNVMYLAWSYDYDASEEVHGPGFLPLVGIRGEI